MEFMRHQYNSQWTTIIMYYCVRLYLYFPKNPLPPMKLPNVVLVLWITLNAVDE